MQNIWAVDAFMFDTRAQLARQIALEASKRALIPAVVWSSLRKSCRAGCRQPAATVAAAATA